MILGVLVPFRPLCFVTDKKHFKVAFDIAKGCGYVCLKQQGNSNMAEISSCEVHVSGATEVV